MQLKKEEIMLYVTRNPGSLILIVALVVSCVFGALGDEVPNANQQCQVIYGESAIFCKEFTAVLCTQLVCRVSANDLYCNNITSIRAAEGTVCGENQVGLTSWSKCWYQIVSKKRLVLNPTRFVKMESASWLEGFKRTKKKPTESPMISAYLEMVWFFSQR